MNVLLKDLCMGCFLLHFTLTLSVNLFFNWSIFCKKLKMWSAFNLSRSCNGKFCCTLPPFISKYGNGTSGSKMNFWDSTFAYPQPNSLVNQL